MEQNVCDDSILKTLSTDIVGTCPRPVSLATTFVITWEGGGWAVNQSSKFHPLHQNIPHQKIHQSPYVPT